MNKSFVSASFKRSLLITGLFDNLESGKEIIVCKKVLVYMQSINGTWKKNQLEILGSKAGMDGETDRK